MRVEVTLEDREITPMENGRSVARSSIDVQAQQRLDMLIKIQETILTRQKLKTTAYLTLDHLAGLIPGCQAGSVIQYTPPEQVARVLALNVNGREVDWPKDLSLVLQENLDDTNQNELLQNLRELDHLDAVQQFWLDQGQQFLYKLELRTGNGFYGWLCLASANMECFDLAAVQTARLAASALGLGFDQASLFEDQHRRRHEADAVRDVMVSLASSVSLPHALEVILRNLGQVVRYDRVALYMQNDQSQFQFPSDLESLESDQNQPKVPKIFPLDDPIIAELRGLTRPIVVEDIRMDNRFRNWPEREFVRAWMGVPLIVDNDIVGIVSLGDLEPGAYSSEDANLAQMFTGQVAEVLWRARSQETSKIRSDELELITSFSFALQQAKSQENILAVIMAQIAHVFGASQGSFLQLERDGSSMVVNFSQAPQLIGQWHTHGNDPLWQAVRSRQPIFISDTRTSLQVYPDAIYRLLFEKMHSAALLPLYSTEANFGVLCFTFGEHLDFSPEDQRSFLAISAIAGTALRRAVILEGLEKQINTRTRHLAALYEISAASSEPVEIEELLAHLLVLTLDVLSCPAGAIHLLDGTQRILRLSAQVGFAPQFKRDVTTLPGLGAFWRAILRADEPLIIPNLAEDSRTPPELKTSPYPALLSAPIKAKGESLGLLSLLSETVLEYTIEDITLFTTIAEQVGSAVERARLQRQAEQSAVAEERQRLARELHDSISQLLYSLVLYAGAGQKVLQQGDLSHTAEYLKRLDQTSQQALKEMRLLVYELRPSVFREEGLVGALNRRLQAVEKRTGINAQLIVEGDLATLDDSIELSLYRIAEEALNNTLKHSQATQVIVQLTAQDEQIDLEIRDNGIGFDLQNGIKAGGLGLIGIQERVSQLGGAIDIQTGPGRGALIHIHLEVNE